MKISTEETNTDSESGETKHFEHSSIPIKATAKMEKNESVLPTDPGINVKAEETDETSSDS